MSFDLVVVTGRFPLLCQPFIERKVAGLARRGHRVTVLAGGRGDHRLDPATAARVRVEYPAGGRAGRAATLAASTRRDPRHAARLAASLRARHGTGRDFARRFELGVRLGGRSADLYHFEWATKAVHALEAIDLLDAPVVVSCRGSDVQVLPAGDDRLTADLPLLFARADLVHCVSQAVLEAATRHGLDPGRAFVNHPAVDTARFSPNGAAPPTTGPLRIVSIGRVHWVKGYEYALHAIRLLVDRGCDVHYTIVGAGDPTAVGAVRFTVDELGLAGRVELVGGCDPGDVPTILARSHVLLLASLSEGLSNAVLEAMSMERPVVVTDVGGMREAVRDGVEGFVVPSRDADAMAGRLAALADDPALRSRLGRAGRARVAEAFTFDRQLDGFEAAYRALAGGR